MYYAVTVPAGDAGEALVVTMSSAATSGSIALYASDSALPTPFHYDEGCNAANQLSETVTVPAALSGATYYVLAHSVSGSAAAAGFTLTVAAVSALTVNVPAMPYTGGNGGNSTIEIDGANFSLNTTASLTLGSATIDASAVQFINSSRIFTTFNLSGAKVGNYALQVIDGAQTVTAPSTFRVTAANTGNPVQLVLTVPSSVRAGRSGTVEVTVTNAGNNDIPAPLLQLTAVGATLELPSQTAYQGGSLYFLATSPTGLAGVLTAGESVQDAIQFEATATSGSVNFQVNQVNGSQAVNWTAFASQTQPTGVDATTWAAVVNNLSATIGTAWGDYITALDNDATRLALRGQATNDASALLAFEVSKAEGEPVGVVTGQVVDAATGQPLANVVVNDAGIDNGSVASATTGANGFFTLSDIYPARRM